VKAAVCYEFGNPQVVEDVDIDGPGPGEVRVRVAATAVCHSDLHLLSGDWGGTLPLIAGHESAGVVEEAGAGVVDVQPGDRVVISLLRSCGQCAYCEKGAAHNCAGSFALDQQSRLRNRAGQPLQAGIRVGAFADEVIVDQSQVARVPASMPMESAALLGCGVITGVGAVLNTAKVRAGESVVVIGAGGVGLNAIQGAAIAGADPIIAIDVVASKLEVAKTFGATHSIHDDPVRSVRKLTRGGADFVFVTVGVPEVVSQAQAMIKPGGTVVVVGMAPLKATMSLRMFDMVWSEQRVIGSRMGGTVLRRDIPRLVDLYTQGRLKLDELITRRYPLTEINEAIESMRRGEALRNIVIPSCEASVIPSCEDSEESGC
jgi:Zn-dependent alcohol dehydrogenase